MSETVKLPERLDTGAFGKLKKELSGFLKNNVKVIDGSSVNYVGGLCLELLIASGIKITNVSSDLKESLALFGAIHLIEEDEL